MNPYVKTEKKIDWRAIQFEVNKKTGRNHSTNYIQNIYHNRLQSSKIRKIIVDLIGEEKCKK